MGEFFKGWRRKVGAVALLVALAAMGMWFRSQYVEEGAGMFVYGRKYAIFSADGELGLSAGTTDKVGLHSYWWSRELSHGYRLGWPVVVQYLEVAVAMTLLSTYLFLWKPKKAKSPA